MKLTSFGLEIESLIKEYELQSGIQTAYPLTWETTFMPNSVLI